MSKYFKYQSILPLIGVVVAFSMVWVSPVLAADPSNPRQADQQDTIKRSPVSCDQANTRKQDDGTCICNEGTVETSFAFGGTNCTAENPKGGITRNPIYAMAKTFMQFLSALVGIAVTGGIIWGGIMYSTAQGNPAQSQKAIMIITNAVLGLILYILMFAIINFLVPGGLFT